jgi:Fe-S-cluster-containing hydrogenase component 2
MNAIQVNDAKCKGCGRCAEQCGWSQVITLDEGKAVYNNDSGKCIKCFHCLKVCPNNAISYDGDAVVYDASAKVNPAIWRRSCRKYLEKEMDRELAARAVNEANTAPLFDAYFNERKFIVVIDKDKLEGVRSTVLAEIKKVKTVFSTLIKIPFISRQKRGNFAALAGLFENILEANKTADKLFHGAPSLIMVAGPKSKTVSPDNSYYALGQLLVIAEEYKLGTCINGFVSFFSKAVAKHLNLDKEYKIYAAAVMGHPADTFHRAIVRNDSSIEWN